MTELGLKIVNPLIDSGKIELYTRFADDTLLLAKEEDINYIFNKFNSFHPSLQFTIDRFDNDKVHFLDIQLIKIRLTYIINQHIQDNILISPVTLLGQHG